MIKLSVPFNCQPDLISEIRKECVEEIYGQLPHDIIGGGRASCILPPLSKKQLPGYIRDAHKAGLKFKYLLNATCLDNKEWTMRWQRGVNILLGWLSDIGVDSVTVAIPFLLELIKKRYSRLKISVSTQAGVDSIARAKSWESLGADEITLSFVDVNRNFHLLRQIRRSVKCRLTLIANLDCLYRCPFYKYHSVLNSHASQTGHPSKGFVIDYCYLNCSYRRFANPSEFIRSPWIRPEDVHYYEDIGIDTIKLVNRSMFTERICLIVNAYTERKYDGNLLDLFSDPSKNIMQKHSKLFHKLKYFFHPYWVNLFKLYQGKDLFLTPKVYIDNKALSGLIEHFLQEDCYLKPCEDCGYCKEVAEKVINIDSDYRKDILDKYSNFLNKLIEGELFSYSSFK